MPRKNQSLYLSAKRHLICDNQGPYEKILRDISARSDIWITTQGSYMAWWHERVNSLLVVTAKNGKLSVHTPLKNAVIQQYPDAFLEQSSVEVDSMRYEGEVVITIDESLALADVLVEILRREGILNYRIGAQGEFFLSASELQSILTRIECNLSARRGRFLEQDIADVRDIIRSKLYEFGLPLLRVWYHPQLQFSIPRAVFSVRHDVDRAISNVAAIRKLELRYSVDSTLYLRPYGPFYDLASIAELAGHNWCSEIAVHGEFVSNSRLFGNEFRAAVGEKLVLEELTGRQVAGVGMHGGERTNNRSPNTDDAILGAGYLYDTTPRPRGYHFPYRKFTDGRFGSSYNLNHAYSDINTPAALHYGKTLSNRVDSEMEKIYQDNGVFVLMMHPVYFGFFRYLFRPKNLIYLLRFSSRSVAAFGKKVLTSWKKAISSHNISSIYH